MCVGCVFLECVCGVCEVVCCFCVYSLVFCVVFCFFMLWSVWCGVCVVRVSVRCVCVFCCGCVYEFCVL